MQLQELINSIPVIQEIMGDKSINFSAGYKLQKITNEIDIVTKAYDESRTELLDQHGTLTEDGKAYEFEDGAREIYNAAMELILTEEIKLDFKKVSADSLKNVTIEPGKVKMIAWMLKD